jgi:colanic acid/amylovoran biosynthesis glycosyltransferase
MKTRIGYMIPEFPGQTHIFFWREINSLENMGVELDIVSTRRPNSKIMSHTWSEQAQQRTIYLFPATKNIGKIFLELLLCGPKGWLRCLGAVLNAKDLSLSQRLNLVALIFMGAELSFIARERGWKHLHVHFCSSAANIAMFAYLISGIPYSMTLHASLSEFGGNQEQKWHFAKFAIVITKKLYQEVNQHLSEHLPSVIEIAPMGVNTMLFQRSKPYLTWEQNTPCYIFSCGRLNRAKGHADLIKSISLLRQKGINAYLKIGGEDEQGGNGYRKNLERLIDHLGLKDFVQLLGAISEDIVKEHLQLSHVFVLASLNEALGVATMEAMSMEVPVIVTKAGGVYELVDDGINGLFVDPESPDQLADAISKLLFNNELSMSFGQEGRKKVIQHFHSQRSAEVLVNAIGIC